MSSAAELQDEDEVLLAIDHIMNDTAMAKWTSKTRIETRDAVLREKL